MLPATATESACPKTLRRTTPSNMSRTHRLDGSTTRTPLPPVPTSVAAVISSASAGAGRPIQGSPMSSKRFTLTT